MPVSETLASGVGTLMGPGVSNWHRGARSARKFTDIAELHARTEGDEPGLAIDSMAAYDDLYRLHHRRVRRLCGILLADPDEADDVTQEVFVRLLRQCQTASTDFAWTPWLTTVAVNACRDRRRSGWWKWWRERHQEFDEADLPHAGRTPEQELVNAEQRRHIWNSFQQLSARQQEVFALRHLEGCSTEEVADILGVSSGSVKRHLYRAVHQMRKSLRGQR